MRRKAWLGLRLAIGAYKSSLLNWALLHWGLENRLAIHQALLDMLVCPACKTPVKLTADGGGLRCAACHLVYPIRDGFPVMIKEEARAES